MASSPLLENVVRAMSPSMHAKLYPSGASSGASCDENTTNTMSSSRKLSSGKPPKGNSESMTSNNSNSASEKTKKENKKKEEFSDDENEEPECTPEKEQVNEGMLPKSPHKSALKPLELRLAARFGQDSPRRKSISFANEEEFQVKLIPKNKTGTPEVTCMISGSLKRKMGEAERLAQESWGLPVLRGE